MLGFPWLVSVSGRSHALLCRSRAQRPERRPSLTLLLSLSSRSSSFGLRLFYLAFPPPTHTQQPPLLTVNANKKISTRSFLPLSLSVSPLQKGKGSPFLFSLSLLLCPWTPITGGAFLGPSPLRVFFVSLCANACCVDQKKCFCCDCLHLDGGFSGFGGLGHGFLWFLGVW